MKSKKETATQSVQATRVPSQEPSVCNSLLQEDPKDSRASLNARPLVVTMSPTAVLPHETRRDMCSRASDTTARPPPTCIRNTIQSELHRTKQRGYATRKSAEHIANLHASKAILDVNPANGIAPTMLDHEHIPSR